MYLRTLPSSVSCKPFACHSYENGRGVYQQFPFRNSALSSRQPSPRLLRRRHQFLPLCALCVLFDLCIKSFLSTFNFGLSTSASLRPIPFLFKLLRTLLHCAKPYPLSFHAILDSLHKTPGGGGGSITRTKRKTAPSRPGRDKFRLSLQGDSQENEGCRRYGAARRGRRKRKKVSGLESRQT